MKKLFSGLAVVAIVFALSLFLKPGSVQALTGYCGTNGQTQIACENSSACVGATPVSLATYVCINNYWSLQSSYCAASSGGGGGTGSTVNITKPSVASSIPNNIGPIINALITLVFIVGFLIAFFFLVFGGVKWIMSGGDKQATQSAREMITAALVGVAIIAFSWALIMLLQTFFGISILNFTIPSVANQ